MISPLNNKSLIDSQRQIQATMLQLSSGRKINSAADDPVRLAISDLMTSQLESQNQAISNATNGLSLTDTAGGALSQITENLQNIRTLTVQAGNGVLSSSDLESIKSQIKGFIQNINDVSTNTQFNGQNLLDGNFSGQIQTGANAGETINLTLGNASSQALGLDNLDMSTPDKLAASLDSVDKALETIGKYQGNVGANAAGLNTALSNLSNSYEQLASANSRIKDTDYATTSSNLAAANLKNRVAINVLKQYQDNQKTSTLGLLGSA